MFKIVFLLTVILPADKENVPRYTFPVGVFASEKLCRTAIKEAELTRSEHRDRKFRCGPILFQE